MVSGIGPEATLKQFGIPVISNLQGVGQNLWVSRTLHDVCLVQSDHKI